MTSSLIDRRPASITERDMICLPFNSLTQFYFILEWSGRHIIYDPMFSESNLQW